MHLTKLRLILVRQKIRHIALISTSILMPIFLTKSTTSHRVATQFSSRGWKDCVCDIIHLEKCPKGWKSNQLLDG